MGQPKIKTPEPPKQEPNIKPNDPQVQAAAQRAIDEMRKKKGRNAMHFANPAMRGFSNVLPQKTGDV